VARVDERCEDVETDSFPKSSRIALAVRQIPCLSSDSHFTALPDLLQRL